MAEGSAWAALEPLPFAPPNFGGLVRVEGDVEAWVSRAEQEGGATRAINACGGLLLIRGLDAVADEPELLLRLSLLFGDDVEDYRHSEWNAEWPEPVIHEDVPQVLLMTDLPPSLVQPGTPPDPPLLPDGSFPVQYPHRGGWHTVRDDPAATEETSC